MKAVRILFWIPPLTPIGVLLSLFAALKKNREATLAVAGAVRQEGS